MEAIKMTKIEGKSRKIYTEFYIKISHLHLILYKNIPFLNQSMPLLQIIISNLMDRSKLLHILQVYVAQNSVKRHYTLVVKESPVPMDMDI